MNSRQRFMRKIAYACAIAVLLLPLSWLSQPATTRSAEAGSSGGVLARMREQHQLSQASLGEIDPAGETIKLVTLGMRGVAANILWEKANYYKKTDNWAALSATLEQIARLQPNFIAVWVFQGWNLSYNVSVEFDNYKDRYYWAIRGIEFLKEGTLYNKNEPRLLSEIGWTIGHKIGRADEHIQFRRLFRADDEFNGALPLAQRDNWLVSRTWLVDAQKMVDEKGAPIRGKSPLLFHVAPVMAQLYYGEALEEEGTFGEVAKNAWRKAGEAFQEYANRDLPTTYNFAIRLNEKEAYQQRSLEAQQELMRLAPANVRETIRQEKIAALSPQDRETLETPAYRRTQEQSVQYPMIEGSLEIGHMEIANRVTGESRAAALKAAAEATQYDLVARTIDNDRDIVNYDYWLLKTQFEPEDNTLEARKLLYEADRAFAAADLVAPEPLYTQAMAKWKLVLDAHPRLLGDRNLIDDLMESIRRYDNFLHQLNRKRPDPFILQAVVDAKARFDGSAVNMAREPSPSASEPGAPSAEGAAGEEKQE